MPLWEIAVDTGGPADRFKALGQSWLEAEATEDGLESPPPPYLFQRRAGAATMYGEAARSQDDARDLQLSEASSRLMRRTGG